MSVDSPGFDAATHQTDFIILTFSKRKVEGGNVRDALDRLISLSDNGAHVRTCLATNLSGLTC